MTAGSVTSECGPRRSPAAFHRSAELRWFDQEIFEQAQAKGSLSDGEYEKALSSVQQGAREDGIDKLLARHELDALIAPTGSAAWTIDLINGDHFIGGSSSLAAVSGYPNITVPMGQVHGMPVGLSIFGAKFTEPVLIEIAAGTPPGDSLGPDSSYCNNAG